MKGEVFLVIMLVLFIAVMLLGFGMLFNTGCMLRFFICLESLLMLWCLFVLTNDSTLSSRIVVLLVIWVSVAELILGISLTVM